MGVQCFILSLSLTMQLSWDVPADTDFLCIRVAVFVALIKQSPPVCIMCIRRIVKSEY